MRKAKEDITICKVLNYKLVVMWGWWKNVDSSDNTLNETEFKMPFLCCLKFNVASDSISRFPGKGPNDCHSKCCVVNTNREEAKNLSKEET